MIIVLSLFTLNLSAVEKNKETKKAVGNYLDRMYSKKASIKLLERNRNEIYRLKVIIANFGKDGKDSASQLKKVLKDYKEGMKLYYTNNYITAARVLKKNREDIASLYKIMLAVYRKQTQELLGKCADELVNEELKGTTSPSVNTDANVQLVEQGKLKLRVAYGQYNMATDALKHRRMAQSIAHLRVARYHGVYMLIALAKDEKEKKQLKSNYKTYLLDSENIAEKPFEFDVNK